MRMTAAAVPQTPSRPGPARFYARLWHLITIRRERRALLNMDDHLLRDIGLTRDQARLEASRPAWNAPARWRN